MRFRFGQSGPPRTRCDFRRSPAIALQGITQPVEFGISACGSVGSTAGRLAGDIFGCLVGISTIAGSADRIGVVGSSIGVVGSSIGGVAGRRAGRLVSSSARSLAGLGSGSGSRVRARSEAGFPRADVAASQDVASLAARGRQAEF